jgi:hypothetical protein
MELSLLYHLEGLDCEIYVYEPNNAIKEVLRKERVPLTPARAMLLSVLFELVKNGEFISEFSAEKVAYFLQRFGAKDVFKLEFKKNFYGPYSSKVKHVLYYLNGSYITGYSSKDKKPFENLGLIFEAEVDVNEYLNQPENSKYLNIVNKTKEFLNGFYSNFGLELLSTVDFIKETKNLSDDFIFYIDEDYIVFRDEGETLFDYNIYKFAFKCKEWAYKNGYDIWSITWGAVEFQNNDKYNGTERITKDTEIEAIIKACNWILEKEIQEKNGLQLQEDLTEYSKPIKEGL